MGKGESFGLVLVSAMYSLNVCNCVEETATHNTCMLPVNFFPTSVLVKVMMSYLQETDTGHEGSHFASYCSLLLFLCIFCNFLCKYSHDTFNNHLLTHTHTQPLPMHPESSEVSVGDLQLWFTCLTEVSW